METVVLNSDIARLVLDYLKSQKLKKATHTFCKTSPYLKQEFSAYKQGLQTHSFFPELEEIICEYVKISRKVEQLLPKLTNALHSQLQQCKLSDKVFELLDRGSQSILANKNDFKATVSTVAASQSNNTTEEQDPPNQTKRKRSFETSNNSSNDENANSNKRHKFTSSHLGHYSKKRRVLQPYCFLSTKALRNKRRYGIKVVASTSEEYALEEETEEVSQTSVEDDNAIDDSEDEEDMEDNDNCGGDGEKPTKESTTRNKSIRKGEQQHVTPTLPNISQAILDNPEFQQKLVENINQALNKSNVTNGTSAKTSNLNQMDNGSAPIIGTTVAGEEITSSQLLDQMIKNILDATEKEPSFNAIIQEVVEASSKPSSQSAAMQCNINTTSVINPPLYAATEPTPLVSTQLQLQQLQEPNSPTTETGTSAAITNRNVLNVTATNAVPRTPIIIRTTAGVAAGNTSVTSAMTLTAQDPPSMQTNNSFGPLIDPNFSISKLIVLNSNDSAQKQHPDNCIGNTTADNLISQFSTSGMVDTNDEQVYFDTATGQLTFPFILTNDGLLTNFPFLINNEVVNQQLQTNNFDGSRLEIPLTEPIVVSANQLPPNSIILSSTQKENVIENPETVEKCTKEVEIKHCNTVPPASIDTRSLYDKATPSSSGIVNTKAFKSLSTPRKRSSHVRTLTFSPRDPQTLSGLGTPLSTRRNAIRRFQGTLPKAIEETDKPKESEEVEENKSNEKDSTTSEKAVIKNVQILPTIANATNVNSEMLGENTNASANESSNIPPLFVSEETSNQTIIDKHKPVTKEPQKKPLKPKALTNFAKTQTTNEGNAPKRKQLKKNAVKSCKRQLSKSSNEELLEEEEKPEKENEKNTESPQHADGKSGKDDMMQEWLRLRSTSNVDLDVRLREINASTQSQVKKVNTKKKVRRKKPAAIKKKEKQLAKEAEELERKKELLNASQNMHSNEPTDTLKSNEVQLDEEKKNEGECNIVAERSTLEKQQKTTSVNEDKITENIDNNTDKAIKLDKKVKEKQKKDEATAKKVDAPPEDAMPVKEQSHDSNVSPNLVPPHVKEALEREKRNTNIAFLLETPFKDPNLASCNPPTPGIFAPSLETPAGKLKDPHDEMQASASFLFGSITKSELDTPLISAVTPGFRFTPFGLKEIGTPKSVTGTDYSSGGGSYYKPDESEDLDRNIDKILRNSAQKKSNSEEANDTDNAEQRDKEEGEIIEDNANDEIDKIEIEIPVEKLKVEPIVLKRVKSFGTEAVDCMETAKIDPHYTLVSGLPEISAAEEESSSSSSSSSFSSSSSKSSSSSSSSTSSSSSSSSSSNASVKSKTVVEATQSNKKVNINDLDSLSEISSTEDEEWQKLAVTDNDENSQLVNYDGEVRYPVRSWLTPIKENMTTEAKTIPKTEPTHSVASSKPATIKVMLPLKSAEKRNRQVKELELKKERMKEKLRNDASTITKKDKPSTSNISAALAASRMLHAMRDKGKKPACFQTQNSNETTAVDTQVFEKQEKRSIDVLTALNLSAKKQYPKTPENPNKTKASPSLPIDDKASAMSPENLKGKSKLHISSSSAQKTPQRKCLPIEARPVTRTIRKSGKKIVRTPLAFKVIHSPGKINSHSTTTTLAEFAATKTLNKSKEVTSPYRPQTVRVSPRLLKSAKLKGKKSNESPAQKTKINTRNSKAKAAAAAAKPVKPKAACTRSNKKKASQPPLDKEMKELLEDWREESLENKNGADKFENQVEAVKKPKINLKARNAMISTKPKTNLKNDQDQVPSLKPGNKKSERNKVEAGEVTPNEQQQKPHCEAVATSPTIEPQPQPSARLTPLAPQQITSFDDDYDDDDDPLEDCEKTTFDETDMKRFITCKYNGPDGPPSVAPPQHDFSNFQMVVAIDENEKHIWRITKGICLFSYAPSLSKSSVPATIPKKRKIRATTVTTMVTPAMTTSTTATNTKIAALKAFSTNTPAATSTPVAVQGTSSRSNDEQSFTKESSKIKTATKSQAIEASKKSTPDTSNETPKIQIEDIESILSHLHGT